MICAVTTLHDSCCRAVILLVTSCPAARAEPAACCKHHVASSVQMFAGCDVVVCSCRIQYPGTMLPYAASQKQKAPLSSSSILQVLA
jgi:hypothetical protein